METLAHPLALLLVAAAPIALLGAVAGAWQWGRWLVGAGGVLGIVGLVATGAAVVNLGVAQTCETDASGARVNRPIISVATGEGDCFRRALGQLELAALAGVGASSVVLLRQARRGGADEVPGAPSP